MFKVSSLLFSASHLHPYFQTDLLQVDPQFSFSFLLSILATIFAFTCDEADHAVVTTFCSSWLLL